MKTRTISGLLAAPFLLSAPALALPSASSGSANRLTTPVAAPSTSLRRHEAIMAVRDEGLKLQAADGGKLTDAHRAYLQAKLDAVRHGNY
ncbi:MAG: hypothetical protein JO056_10175 [Alphaproteobacteria bacterium]|nr:hypothetical protein [Alphaproteobacteria bacterium]